MGGNLSPNNRDPASAGYSYSQTGEGVQKKLPLTNADRLPTRCDQSAKKTKEKQVDWLIDPI